MKLFCLAKNKLQPAIKKNNWKALSVGSGVDLEIVRSLSRSPAMAIIICDDDLYLTSSLVSGLPKSDKFRVVPQENYFFEQLYKLFIRMPEKIPALAEIVKKYT